MKETFKKFKFYFIPNEKIYKVSPTTLMMEKDESCDGRYVWCCTILQLVLQTSKSAAAQAQYEKNFPQHQRQKMGIFSNPSDVPIPGPPPKKETVRVELAGCGLLVKFYCQHNVECLNTFLTSVAKWPGLPCCPVQNVMPVSGPLCQLQPKTLVF